MTSAGQHDKLLYTSQPFFFSQPASLAAMAALYGVQTAPVEGARVLELGCASGGNIIPLAARFPNALGLANIKLEAADIIAFAEREEEAEAACPLMLTA